MSFLHRRSRSASASRPQTPASASAHKAATQAFLSSRASQANLSASAAAQAIRTMSPPPVPIDQIQTKRMIQRQASNGSLSKSARGRGRGGLERQNSGGSMTERTFRTPSPSPSRPVSRAGPQAPPMPSIPQQFAVSSPVPVKKKKRSSSQEAPPPRILSPPPTRPNNRGQSLDRFGAPQPPPPPPSTPRNNHIPQSEDLERLDSRNSVNFSRPLSPRPQSPIAQSPIAHSPMTNGDRASRIVRTNAVAPAISPAQTADIQYNLMQAANQPVKKKKKKVVAGTVEGSHLHTGTIARTVVHNEADHDPQFEPTPQEQQPVRKKKKKAVAAAAAVSGENSHFPNAESPRTDSDSDYNVDGKKDRKTQRASGILNKQPSIVREDWEGEQEEETTPPQYHPAEEHPAQDAQSPLQDKRPANAANVSRRIESPITAPAMTTQPLAPESQNSIAQQKLEEAPATSSYLQVTEPQTTRGTSLSPSRSTRFSDRLSSDLAAGRKHEPLPRSVSPAKPALKHSTAVGADGQPRGSSVTPSESSDISSVDVPAKRKKSVRVSFDAQPEIVGPSASDQSPVGSPAKDRKSWLGLGKNKPPLNTIPSNEDMEELMKPRPQLPSFGSVRGQKSKETNNANTTQTHRSASGTLSAPAEFQSGTSSEASSIYTPNAKAGASNDHAVGAILAQEAQKSQQQTPQHRSNEPLPPQVTSVEGVLSYSDEESEVSEVESTLPTTAAEVVRPPQGNTVEKSLQASSVNQQVTAPVPPVMPIQPEVPTLALSPPTPAEEQRPLDQWLVEVPGGFPVSADSLARLDESYKARRGQDDSDDSDQEASDNDSIYSDTAQDASELEGLGFGSIDAILGSPGPPPPTRVTSPPKTPLAEASTSPPPANASSWEETQARWSGIAQQTREAPAQRQVAAPIESPMPATANVKPAEPVAAESSAVAASQTPVTQSVRAVEPSQPQGLQPPLPIPKRKKRKSPAAIAAAASVPMTASQGSPEPPIRTKKRASANPAVESSDLGHAAAAAAPFRHSMKASSPGESESGLRKSMRNENRKSMPASAMSQPQQRAIPPATYPPPSQTRATLQKKHIPLAQAAAVTAPKPRAQPAAQPVADDSDSESSFRKARRNKAKSDGKYSMRRSMRGAAEPTLRGDGRNAVRSVSPEGRRAFSPPDTSRSMKTSMRASMDNTPTLRGPPETKRSSSLFGRQQKRAPAPVSGFTSQNNRSRVLDSDDEEEAPRPSKFRSRFADDSDDEIDVPQFAPVRGIPRRNNDAESTDLDDSSEEDRPTPAKTPPKLQIPQNTAIAPGNEPLSPNSEKKRGLLGLFRSKKPKEEAMSPVAESPQGPARTTTDTSKPSRLGFASNAERDRVIAETRAKLEASRGQQQPTGPQQGTGKLQRRQMPERIMSDSWPLPPPIPDDKQRPTTSDGPSVRNGTTRLNQGSMRRPGPANDVVGRGGKKKKFPMLRKAFGLKD